MQYKDMQMPQGSCLDSVWAVSQLLTSGIHACRLSGAYLTTQVLSISRI